MIKKRIKASRYTVIILKPLIRKTGAMKGKERIIEMTTIETNLMKKIENFFTSFLIIKFYSKKRSKTAIIFIPTLIESGMKPEVAITTVITASLTSSFLFPAFV